MVKNKIRLLQNLNNGEFELFIPEDTHSGQMLNSFFAKCYKNKITTMIPRTFVITTSFIMKLFGKYDYYYVDDANTACVVNNR